MTAATEKDLSVETLRGGAILLVVAGHVIGDGPSYAMRVADDSFFRYFYSTLVYIRIPLFTVISGWVYDLRPAGNSGSAGFVLKKARRLLIPMIFVGGLYYLAQNVTPGTTNKNDLSAIWRLFVFPFTLYWYLPSLFFVFLIVSVTDRKKLLSNPANWLIFMAIAILMLVLRTHYVSNESPNVFSYKGVIYLLPFFLTGLGVHRFSSLFRNNYVIALLVLLFISGVAVQQLSWFRIIAYTMHKGSGAGLLIGLTGIPLLLRMPVKGKWLIRLGGFSYSIYLFHAFGTAGARIALRTAGVDSQILIFLISLFTGLMLPVLIEKVTDRYRLTRLLFLGRAYNLPVSPATEYKTV